MAKSSLTSTPDTITVNLYELTLRIKDELALDETSPFNRQVTSRVTSLAMIPLSVLSATIDTLGGTLGATGAILTAGINKKIWRMTINLTSTRHILNLPYLNLLRFINPRAGMGVYANGIIYGIIEKSLKLYLEESYLETLRSPESNFFNREITPRINYLLFSLVTIVTRAVDGLIGLVATILSLVTLGTNAKINALAFCGLAGTGIIYDLFYCAVKIINPNAGIFSYD